MPKLEFSQDKVQQLCDLLHNQAIEPAQNQAREILSAAQKQAEEIVQKAREQAAQILADAQDKARREREILETALKQAAKQAVQSLRQEIENNLLGNRIHELAKSALSKEELIANLVKAYAKAIEQQGFTSDFCIQISKHTDMDKLAQAIGKDLFDSLREGKLLQILPQAGVRVQLHDQHLTIDCTESTLSELLAQFLRKDLRERLFAKS